MTVFFLIFLLIGAYNTRAEKISEITESIDDRFVLNTVIRQLFELFRIIIKNGDYMKDVPILDPYEFDGASLAITKDLMSATMNFTNSVLTGLAGYQLGPFNFDKNSLSIDLELTFPQISFLSEYYEFGVMFFGLLPVSGNGNMEIKIHGTVINAKIYLKQSDDNKSILISHFENGEFTIRSIESNTDIDGNIDGIVNNMVSDLLADYLSRFSQKIFAIYGNNIVIAVNSILKKFESWKIIAVIL